VTAVKIKICGITHPDDALACIEAGADAIGLNLIPSSPRCVTLDAAREVLRLVSANAPHLLTVAVIADLSTQEMVALQAEFQCLQLHGHEDPSQLELLLPHAYKALRIGTAEDVAAASIYPGEHLLVDAKVPGSLGGTGRVFDWRLVCDLARTRKLTLAGGLNVNNISDAISTVRPYAIDVSSGVESAANPRRKDVVRIRDFVREARASG